MRFEKFFAIFGLNWISLSNGFVFGQVACVVNALQKKEEGIDLSEGQISLIASFLIIMNTIGFALAAITTDKFGRRWPFTIFSIPIVLNWIVLYYARHMYQFMISRVLGGTAVGALLTLNIFVTAEYVNPKVRAFYLNMVTTVAPAVGSTLAHAVGIALNWRYVALFGIIPAFMGIFLPYFWVESPHWLASKGRYEECQIAFRKLHGNTQNTERELHLLIKTEKSKHETRETDHKPKLKKLLLILTKKSFWDPIILSVFMLSYITATGKITFTVLASVMLEQITGTSDVMFFTLLVDGFVLLGSCLSCFLIMKTSLRNLLFTSGTIANLILVLFSVLYYYKKAQSHWYDWIIVSLLSLYFVIINAGPHPLLEALYSEIYPLELKVYIFTFIGVVINSAFSLSIFLLPYIVNGIGYHGFFLVNVGIMTVSMVGIWLRLPETKGRTLQEIEVYFKTKSFDIERVLNNEQTKALV